MEEKGRREGVKEGGRKGEEIFIERLLYVGSELSLLYMIIYFFSFVVFGRVSIISYRGRN